MDIISNNPNIIRRNDQTELEINGQAVPGSNFNELYAAILTPKRSQHMVGMTELLGALRQLNVESKDIVSAQIKFAYEIGASRPGPLCHHQKALQMEPQKTRKQKPKVAAKDKKSSTTPIESEGPFEAKPATRSTTKFNTPRQVLDCDK